MTQSPFDLPPGPERRALMREAGINVGRDDFTDEEWAAAEAETAARRAGRAAD